MIPGRTARDLNKPPRPPKMRPAHRLERRITTDCVGLPPRIRYVPTGEDEMGVATSSLPMEYTSLRGLESPATPMRSVDDSYANYESIYRNRGRRVSKGGEVEKIDSQRLDVLMRPYMTSTNPEAPPPSPPPPPSGFSGGPIYRTEVRHRPSIGENFVGQLNNFVSAFMELDVAPSNVIIGYSCQLSFTYQFALKSATLAMV